MITLETDKIYSVSDAEDIMQAALKGGTCYKSKSLNYYNIIAAFDIETSNFISSLYDDSYKVEYIYKYIKGSKIRCPDIDINSYDNVKGITLSKTTGENLDTYYQELCDMFPGFVDSSIVDPDKQLRSIIRLYLDNMPRGQDADKYSIMYCWQFAINGKVIFGRYWNEFINLMDIIGQYTNKNKRMIVYVHNLSFEFQFLRKLLTWVKVFSISTRKPIYAITDFGIEFRCSYILTNLALADLAGKLKHYKIKKLVGSLDYDLIRSPETPMQFETEIRYCINDVLVISAYIQECILEERFIANIPLTATGYCRRYARKMCLYGEDKKLRTKQYNHYRAIMQSLKIQGKKEYDQLKRAFAGGFTHASSRFSQKTQSNVKSYDEASAYIFTLCCELLPMSTSKEVKPKTREEFEHYLKYYCCIFDAEFIDIEATFLNDNYISISHCYVKENPIKNNGRLFAADRICTTITNVDFEIIRKTYKYKSMRVKNMRIYKKAFLPRELILAVIKLYKDKTSLKGVKGKETEYNNAKALLNSVY